MGGAVHKGDLNLIKVDLLAVPVVDDGIPIGGFGGTGIQRAGVLHITGAGVADLAVYVVAHRVFKAAAEHHVFDLLVREILSYRY